MSAPEDYNRGADFWRYEIGVNVIPADTRNKTPLVSWSTFQNNPVPVELHNKWKSNGDFSKGMAIIPGKIFHRKDRMEHYLVCIDADNLKAIVEMCTRNGKIITVQKFAEKTLVEEHRDDPSKAHFYFYSPRPFAKKSSDVALLSDKIGANKIPAFEVKGLGEHGIMYCTPSIHKDGHQYEILGKQDPVTLNLTEANELEKHLDDICKRNGIQYLEKGQKSMVPIEELFVDGKVIHEGHNRHEAVLELPSLL